MPETDRVIMRAVAFTLCVSTVILIFIVGFSAIVNYEVADAVDRLAFLLVGGMIQAFSTKLTGKGPVEVETAPGDVVSVEAAPVEATPDKPVRSRRKAEEIVTGE